MERLLILLIDVGVFSVSLLVGIITLLLIQLVSYRIFKFNIYKTILKLIYKYI